MSKTTKKDTAAKKSTPAKAPKAKAPETTAPPVNASADAAPQSARELAAQYLRMDIGALKALLGQEGERIAPNAKKPELVKQLVSLHLRRSAAAPTAPQPAPASSDEPAPTPAADDTPPTDPGTQPPTDGTGAKAKSPGRKADPAANGLSVGQTLTRVYKGTTYVVTVESDGFSLGGKRYSSLTAIALELAGARNGWQWFGLRPGMGAKNPGARTKRSAWFEQVGLGAADARALANARRALQAHADKLGPHVADGALASVIDGLSHLVNGWATAEVP
jgi:hypothetical protein